MTKEQYQRLTAPFQKNPFWKRLLLGAERGLTAVVFVSYPLLLLYLLQRHLLHPFLRCVFIPAVSFGAVSVFRALYSAPRPYEKLGIEPLIPKETVGKSFPSRHVFSVFMIAVTVYQFFPWMGIGMGILGVMMACIRVIAGVHFPVDVAAGAALGILCGMLYYIGK